jgi:hypothetical protein
MILAGAGTLPLRHRVQTASGHPASYSMDTGGSFPRSPVAGGVKLTAHLHLVSRLRMRGVIHTSTPIRLNRVAIN